MARIVNKLDLNRTPQNCENYSMVFAQNVKLGKDNVLCKDDGIVSLGLEDYIDGAIIAVIPYNTCFFILVYNTTSGKSSIIRYEEYKDSEHRITEIESAWHYSGGNIDGNVVQTLNGDTILSIAEYFDDPENHDLIPLKFININQCSASDNESIYSQLPEVPFINLTLKGTYANPIPNGVYQFFIRYEIYKECYTEWFPATKECFAGTPQVIDKTQLGTIKYLDTSYQSSESFVFNVNRIITPDNNPYKKFQVGFILSTDDKVVARSWKLFDINTVEIYFDYDKEYIEELDIEDIIRPAFDIYNVKNITMFKNKQYISNFIETNYNPKIIKGIIENNGILEETSVNLVEESKKINVNLATESIDDESQTNKYRVKSYYKDYAYSTWPNDINVLVTNEPETSQSESGDIYIQTAINNLIKTEYYKYQTQILKDEDGIGNRPYSDVLIDYGIYLRATCKESDTKRYTQLSDLESDQIYGPILNSIKDKFNIASGSEHTISHLFMRNPSFAGENHVISSIDEDDYEDRNDIAICNGLRTKNNAYGFVEFDRTSNDDEDITYRDLEITEDTEEVEVDNRTHTRVQTLSISHIATHITSYYESDNRLFHTIFSREDTINQNYSPYEDEGQVPLEDVVPCNNLELYSIIYMNGKWVCKTLTIELNSLLSNKYINDSYLNYTTLLPFQEYKFYIHYVKANGETTNGYVINGGEPVVYTNNSRHDIIYPTFDFRRVTTALQPLLAKEYVGYFISIQHYKRRVVELIDTPLYCLELDAKLYYSNKVYAYFEKNNHGVISNKKVPVIYRTSNDNTILTLKRSGSSETYTVYRFFGNTGIVDIEVPEGYDWSHLKYIYMDYENDSEDIQLIKATPYYDLDFTATHDDYDTLNLGGYICNVNRIKIRNVNGTEGEGYNYETLFFSADTIYRKYADEDILRFEKIEYKHGSSVSSDDTNMVFDIWNSPSNIIYSNFNLNYIGLTENGMSMITPQIKSLENKASSGQVATPNEIIPWYNFNSLQLSSFYKLEQMYKDYTRKTYSKYNEEAIVKFDNTIRCSELVGDEEKLYRYSFDINDYYHLTPNKGKIVNLFAVGIALVAHTEDSMFKFSGSASFSNEQGGSVQAAESDLFVAGASEIFGSQYGYGGLQKKENSLITEAGYFFYDKHANTIYCYKGGTSLKVLSDVITKLVEYVNIDRVDFASDLKNDRIFININYIENTVSKYLTLSYNLAANNLISLHTFDYDYTFNTKVNCYFVLYDTIYSLDRNAIGYNKLTGKNEHSIMFQEEKDSDNNYPAIIDIIFNNNYESIKLLDSINWICEEIAINNSIFKNSRATVETRDLQYKGDYIRLYSDSVDTGNIDISQRSINEFDNYKAPHYERGVWIMNYFRNILNLFNTPGLPDKTKNGNYVSDETTLIYGKYIIARFIFNADRNFKLENVTFNTSKI